MEYASIVLFIVVPALLLFLAGLSWRRRRADPERDDAFADLVDLRGAPVRVERGGIAFGESAVDPFTLRPLSDDSDPLELPLADGRVRSVFVARETSSLIRAKGLDPFVRSADPHAKGFCLVEDEYGRLRPESLAAFLSDFYGHKTFTDFRRKFHEADRRVVVWFAFDAGPTEFDARCP